MTAHLLQKYLDDVVDHTPSKVAVVDSDCFLTYKELAVFANQIAHCLKTMGVNRQQRVVVVMQRSMSTVAAILGVLKADAVYIPVDSKSPAERWVTIIDDADADAIVCDDMTVDTVLAATKGAIPVLNLGNDVCMVDDDPVGDLHGLETVMSFTGNKPDYDNHSEDLAYILYTSGSTGRPKGVMVSHANVVDYVDWAVKRFAITRCDRILGTAPFHFDMSVFDIYCAFKAGATLCLASETMTLFPEKLAGFMEEQRVTIWKGVSSLLMYMARAGVLCPGRMPALRQVLFAGETLPQRYLVEWMKSFPDKTFYNAYGPTEATGVSICYRVESIPDGPDAPVPIGRPRDGTRVLLLDENKSEVLPGEVGEICLAGAGLARGYLNDEGKTAGSFVSVPQVRSGDRVYLTGDLGRLRPDGNLEYLGRKDRQLKFLGYRIEAGEVEKALMTIPDIKDTAVSLVESKRTIGMMELVAYWEADAEIDVPFVSDALKKLLPPYMIPKRFIRVDKMPRCSRGKLDLTALVGQG